MTLLWDVIQVEYIYFLFFFKLCLAQSNNALVAERGYTDRVITN